MKHIIMVTLLDIINNYTANDKSATFDVLKSLDRLPLLAESDVESLCTITALTFVAFQIEGLKEATEKYERLCSSILIVTGSLPYHLIYLSQDMSLFSKYIDCYQKYLQIKIDRLGGRYV